VDLTTDGEEDMETPASPSPHVYSGDEEDMPTDEEDRYLGPYDSSSDEGSQRV